MYLFILKTNDKRTEQRQNVIIFYCLEDYKW